MQRLVRAILVFFVSTLGGCELIVDFDKSRIASDGGSDISMDFPVDTPLETPIDQPPEAPPDVPTDVLSDTPSDVPLDVVGEAECMMDIDCDDDNTCTTDTCNPSGACVHASTRENMQCDGGDPCRNALCRGGVCTLMGNRCGSGEMCSPTGECSCGSTTSTTGEACPAGTNAPNCVAMACACDSDSTCGMNEACSAGSCNCGTASAAAGPACGAVTAVCNPMALCVCNGTPCTAGQSCNLAGDTCI